MNSTAAANLKTKWTDIVNCFAVQDEAVQELTDETLSFLEVQRMALLKREILDRYDVQAARDQLGVAIKLATPFKLDAQKVLEPAAAQHLIHDDHEHMRSCQCARAR